MIEILRQRRDKLIEQWNDNEVGIIFAANEPTYPRYFKQDNNFLYFTGLNVPKAVLMLGKIKGNAFSKLFIEREIPEMVVWEGHKLSPKEARETSGIEQIAYVDEFYRAASITLYSTERCYVNMNYTDPDNPLSKGQAFVKGIQPRFPHIQFRDVLPTISPLRAVKDVYEVEQIDKAIDATGAGIEAMMNNAEPGMMEYELEALLHYEVQRRGMPHMGFKSIVASGVNAATLHYGDNNCPIGEDDLILMDVGAGCNNYSADITRTFHVTGNFNQRQKDVYQAVLDVNKAIIEMVKPGLGLADLNRKTIELISEALIRLGLITDKADFRKYYMHSVTHHLGMDTHDIVARDSILEAGNIITVEPGIYIKEEGIGVRIEDDILVTETGYRNLSSHIPKEIADLEALAKK